MCKNEHEKINLKQNMNNKMKTLAQMEEKVSYKSYLINRYMYIL